MDSVGEVQSATSFLLRKYAKCDAVRRNYSEMWGFSEVRRVPHVARI